MNLRQLEIFRAVMQTGTTSGAARELNVSQPAVSNMIKHIESNLGLVLFERDRGRLSPTEDAEALFREIEPLFLFFRSVEQKIDDIRMRRTGLLRVVATATCASSCVLDGIKQIMDRHPGVQISLDVQRTDSVVEQVVHNIADVGVSLEAPEHPALRRTPLHLGRLVCVVPKDHPLAEKETIRPGDLANVPFIALDQREGPLGKVIEEAFTAAGETLEWSIETGFCANALSMVDAGIGCALVDEFALDPKAYPNVAVKPFLPRIPLTIYALVASDRPASWMVKTFLRKLEAVAVDIDLDGEARTKESASEA